MSIRPLKIRHTLFVLGLLSCLLNITFAQGAPSEGPWKRLDLLDEKTKSSLSSYERFFAGLFPLPADYERASPEQKDQLIQQWLGDLQGMDAEKITAAAAYLGIVRVGSAARALEKAITDGRGGGRGRWICTRSLGQIGDKDSIPFLINLLDNQNQNTAVYARVALAEITGEYFGENKEKWIIRQSGEAPFPPAASESTKTSASVNNTEAIRELRKIIDENYSYRDQRGVDWDKLFELHKTRLQQAKSPREFAEAAGNLLMNAKDMHLWVKIQDQTISGYRRTIVRNYNPEQTVKGVPGWRDLSSSVSMGRFGDGIGYILIKSWQKDEQQVLKPALDAIRSLSDCWALILDVRPNGGGSEPLAGQVAGCFINQPIVYAKSVYRDINTPTGWSPVRERTLKPNSDLPTYTGKTVVLMGQACMSSCESFLLMMKQVPNCKLIGERSYGSSGNPKPHDLGNGVTVWLPSWKDLRPDGSCFEGQGIVPDIPIKTTERQLKDSDPVLETALRYLRNSLKR